MGIHKKYLCEAFERNRALAGPLQGSDVGESTVVEVPAHLQCPSWF